MVHQQAVFGLCLEEVGLLVDELLAKFQHLLDRVQVLVLRVFPASGTVSFPTVKTCKLFDSDVQDVQLQCTVNEINMIMESLNYSKS